MSETWRASLSLRFDDLRTGVKDRWARVDLEDFFWLGRCSICNLMFENDESISRLHAIIQRDGDAYRLTDMQSMNGTWVNDRDVRSCVLRRGDRIRMGQTHFVFAPERADDTVFREGTSRTTGAVTLTLRSFPTSLVGVRPPEELTRTQSFREVPEAPATRGDAPPPDERTLPEGMRAQGPPLVAPLGGTPLLETFLITVIDRVVSELRAVRGIIHVPAVLGRAPLSIARGWFDGKLDVLKVPADLVERISSQLAAPALEKDGGYAEVGDLVRWFDDRPHDAIKAGTPVPSHQGWGWSVTVPLPAVGRANSDRKPLRALDGVAWLHVQLDTVSPQSSPARIVEVAGGTAAATIRFLERAHEEPQT